MDFQFFDGQKVIVIWILKVNDRRFFLLGSAAGSLHGHGNAIPDEGVLFLIDLHEGGGGKMALHLLLGLVQLDSSEPRIEPLERLPKISGKQNFAVACPAKGAALAQLLGVVGVSYLPAQLPL